MRHPPGFASRLLTRGAAAWLLCLLVLPPSACQRAVEREEPRALPVFGVNDSEGNFVRSEDFLKGPLVVALFDVESVLAWRTLAELQELQGRDGAGRFALLAVGGLKGDAAAAPDVNALKAEYGITSPVVFDRERRLPELFRAEGCCNSLYLYRPRGRIHSTARLSESSAQLPKLISELLKETPPGAASRSPADEKNLLEAFALTDSSGRPSASPAAEGGLTVVCLFDRFCDECATGQRLQNLDNLAKITGGGGRALAVFSKDGFSAQDVENMKQMLPARVPMLLGDVERVRPYFAGDKLLLVFDARGEVVWYERPQMSEREIFDSVARLLKEHAR